MIEESIETIPSAQRVTGKITDSSEIRKMLSELAERKELLFFNAIGAKLAFFAKVTTVDAQHRIFQIAATTTKENRSSIRVGNAFDVLVPIRNTDLRFKTSLMHVAPEQINIYRLSIPSTLHLRHRREHPRGQCFGLVEIIMRRKDEPQRKGMKAALCDISHSGLGISLPEGTNPSVRAGDAFDDCLLLLHGKPIAMCTIEVVHTRQGPKTGSLIAGARFIKLDDVAKQRITKLITALKPVVGEPTPGTVD